MSVPQLTMEDLEDDDVADAHFRPPKGGEESSSSSEEDEENEVEEETPPKKSKVHKDDISSIY